MLLYEIQSGQPTGRVLSQTKEFSKKNFQQRINLFEWFLNFFKEVFLPTGYPNSVSSDYLSYQIWDTIQAFASSITNALAFSAILEGMGVGDAQATVVSATFVWLIKDGMGMLGQIIFAWFHGTGLDSNLKMWRFYADILNDLAISISLLAPFFKDFFLLTSCLSNLCRSIVGVAGGATRAALTQHQAVSQNIADVSAKDGSQETLVNLVALLVNLFLLHSIKGDRILVWSLYFLLTFLHLFANYRAIRSLKLRTFNWNRFTLLSNDYFRFNRISSIESINQREPLLFQVRQSIRCDVGVNLDSEKAQSIDLEKLNNERFVVAFEEKSKLFQVFLSDQCADQDLIRCYFILQYLIYKSEFEEFFLRRSNVIWINVEKLREKLDRSFDDFIIKSKNVGWDVEQTKFLISPYRYICKKS